MPAERASPRTLTLYGREGCHLCEAMQAALEALRPRFGFELSCIDVDDDPELARRYGALVPVLFAGGRELCHHVLDQAALAAHLDGMG